MGLIDFKKKNENKLSEESAKTQLDLLFDYYGVDIDNFQEEQKSTTAELIAAIRAAKVEIKEQEDDVVAIQTLRSGQTLEYKGLCLADAKIAMKAAKSDDQYGKIYALLGSLSGVGIEGIKKLAPSDLSIAESLGLVFL